MDAVRSSGGTVRFSKKHPAIGIRKSETEISVNHIGTGQTVVVETYRQPFATFTWTADGKLDPREVSDAFTANMLLSVKRDFGLVPVEDSRLGLVRIFPDVESLGVIAEELAGINSFSVSGDGTKLV